jgi:hypothetical protein
MAPTVFPDEGMLVLIPVGGGAFNRLLDLGPSFEPATFQGGSVRSRGSLPGELSMNRFYPERCCTKRVRDFSVKSGYGKQFDDAVYGFVGAVVGGFELAVWAVFGVGTVVEAAVGERTAEPLVKEEEEQGNLYALLRGEPVGVSGTVAFH